MAEVLTQDEIDSLINALVEDKAPAGATGAREERLKKTRAYDFRRPDKFSKEQLRALYMVHENMVRNLTTQFSATFRSMVQIVVGSVDQNTYSDFIRSLASPTALCPFALPPLKGTCLLDINPALAFPMLDRLFGGPGSGADRTRELTAIEKAAISRICNSILTVFQNAWGNIVRLELNIEPLETNPTFVQVAAPNDMVVTIALDVRVGQHVGTMTLCLPYLTLEPILNKLSAKTWFAAVVQREGDLAALQRRVGVAAVPISVELGRTTLLLSEVLDLGPGDVLVLDRSPNELLLVHVDDRPKFLARPGRRKGRMAIQVEAELPEGGEENE